MVHEVRNRATTKDRQLFTLSEQASATRRTKAIPTYMAQWRFLRYRTIFSSFFSSAGLWYLRGIFSRTSTTAAHHRGNLSQARKLPLTTHASRQRTAFPRPRGWRYLGRLRRPSSLDPSVARSMRLHFPVPFDAIRSTGHLLRELDVLLLLLLLFVPRAGLRLAAAIVSPQRPLSLRVDASVSMQRACVRTSCRGRHVLVLEPPSQQS